MIDLGKSDKLTAFAHDFLPLFCKNGFFIHQIVLFNLCINLWYFGGFVVFMACCMGFMLWFVPSLDEIASRRVELDHLTAKIEKAQNLQCLQTSHCDKRLCVKVIESKCNYGSKGDRYCVAELK
ncbi:hypothetical protein [Moraxella nasicaprae]|uniref:Uncharacterized protein n=1 Tax=Moraxella nasicaprae TaxID=2904122 RepID=A0ABY6F6B4_9GAMM|nr:hypothetical protein [Moraxella nasicaprae]UXZ05625.1 hypothetical protein LU297_04070 [Moraxella nasicaprae]